MSEASRAVDWGGERATARLASLFLALCGFCSNPLSKRCIFLMVNQLESLLSYFVCLVTGLLLLVMLRRYPVWRYIRRVQKLVL